MIFSTPSVQARELEVSEVPRLQALFDANPDYFQAVNGRPANPDEAQVEFDELPPAHLPFKRRWFIGLVDRGGELMGVAVVVSDLISPGVWHLALLWLVSALHGRGLAREVYAAIETWAHDSGACWMRLGVIVGNARAERFWERNGFVEVRQRHGIDTGGKINDQRVMIKPLRGQPIAEYWAIVPRDHPESTLP